MPRETSFVETVARQLDLPPGKVLQVLDHSFRELHRRMYEYDGVNGDYICERLIHELSEMAWIHLYPAYFTTGVNSLISAAVAP